ncbi:MAG: formate/nitrite transporter [Bacillales bacterium]|jgi:nitrite transporter NirC|nr:formate/nitrite transporter [Bacillales bacterium]
MEIRPIANVEKLALKKYKIYNTSKSIYLLRAILASMFLGFGVIVSFKTGNLFYQDHSPLAYPMAAITFGSGIILISYGGGDLFTGNTFYFTITALRKKLKWDSAFRLLTYSYIGNIIGAVLFALLIYSTGLFNDTTANSFLLTVAEKKIHTSTSELFFRGILCNWLVCLAFFIPMTLRGDGPKLFVMILFVFCFFISGYEHSIANMCTFAIALIIDHPNTISINGVIHNLIPVTFGNLIGGQLLMGLTYYYINKPFYEEY